MKCELCKKEIDQRNSHNGQPLVNGRVCSDCNYKVIMARLKEAEKAKEKKSSTENVETVGTGGQVNITDPMKNFEEYAKKFEETFILGKQPVRKENPENKVKEEKGGFTGEVEGLDKEKTQIQSQILVKRRKRPTRPIKKPSRLTSQLTLIAILTYLKNMV